jgi:hypothetical protein
MKKFTPYIIAFLILAFVTVIIIAASRKLPRKMDERITLREKDKIPYGMAAAKNLSGSIFPDADVSTDDRSPGYWDEISSTSSGQAVIIVAGYFSADEYELRQLMNFVEKGNYVFIIARAFSDEAQSAFHFTWSQNMLSSLFSTSDDSLRVQLIKPAFESDSFYTYPGRKFESWFQTIDTAYTTVLGTNGSSPNFIRMDKGYGSFFIHSAPLAFSNYFILHKNNIHYYEQALSVIPRDVRKIVWNEFYLTQRRENRNYENRDKEPNWLSVLLGIRAFRWGFFLLLLLLLLWVLLNSRRKQRMIPDHPKPKNDSLDFVKTMGRLYYDRRDHYNLAKKMSTYFLEHVRSIYKLPTHTLDEPFVDALYFKSGYPRGDLNEIVSFIQYLQHGGSINEHQLIIFHDHLESFYQNT